MVTYSDVLIHLINKSNLEDTQFRTSDNQILLHKI